MKNTNEWQKQHENNTVQVPHRTFQMIFSGRVMSFYNKSNSYWLLSWPRGETLCTSLVKWCLQTSYSTEMNQNVGMSYLSWGFFLGKRNSFSLFLSSNVYFVYSRGACIIFLFFFVTGALSHTTLIGTGRLASVLQRKVNYMVSLPNWLPESTPVKIVV